MGTVALIGFPPDLEGLILEALRSAGYTARAFVLHGDIVPVLGRLRLDALLLDGHPFTNLPALVRAVREQPATAALPIVVITAKLRDDLEDI
ncbi:MAG TPA: hypothetical protein VFX49_16805, partial [Chloroflexota bacterium]|nr:hypothetical protein [Chloroflexota bacterium]